MDLVLNKTTGNLHLLLPRILNTLMKCAVSN